MNQKNLKIEWIFDLKKLFDILLIERVANSINNQLWSLFPPKKINFEGAPPGIEPGSRGSKPSIMPLEQGAFILINFNTFDNFYKFIYEAKGSINNQKEEDWGAPPGVEPGPLDS